MLLDDVCDGCPQCMDLCEPCWEKGRDVPAVNQWYVRAYDATPMCAECDQKDSEAAFERQQAAGLNGGESLSEQAHREQRMK